MDLKELELGVNPAIHWYYQSKKIPLIRFVNRVFNNQKQKVVIIDVGSGSGFFMYELLKQMPGKIEKIWLVDINYSEKEIQDTKDKIVEKTKVLPPVIENAVVVMMDVLEHIENDTEILSRIKTSSKGKNHFFITVPAFMDLWSGHDIYLGHYRRYTSKTLRQLLNRVQFSEFKIYYLYATIFPLVWIVRKIKAAQKEANTTLKPLHPFINFLLRKYNSFEMIFSRRNKLFGVTCTAEGEI